VRSTLGTDRHQTEQAAEGHWLAAIPNETGQESSGTTQACAQAHDQGEAHPEENMNTVAAVVCAIVFVASVAFIWWRMKR
jgi:hypothetical protein